MDKIKKITVVVEFEELEDAVAFTKEQNGNGYFALMTVEYERNRDD